MSGVSIFIPSGLIKCLYTHNNALFGFYLTNDEKSKKIVPPVFRRPTDEIALPDTVFVNGMVAPYILCHSGTINPHYLSGATIMNVKTIGIDLVKEVFLAHGIDEHGKRLFNRQLKRTKMLSFFA